jgi:hypothetical protein
MNWISQDKFRFSGSVQGFFRDLVQVFQGYLFGLLKDTSTGFSGFGLLVWFFFSASGRTEMDDWIRAFTFVRLFFVG